MFVRRIVARVGRSRLVVGPCIASSLRSGVALALDILFFAPLSIVTKQKPLKTKQAPCLFLCYNREAEVEQEPYVDCNEARAPENKTG